MLTVAQKKYRSSEKGRAAQHVRAKRYSDSEKGKTKQREYRFKHDYGITIKQYDEMFERQSGVCAICHRPEAMKGRRLSVDHIHGLAKSRGLLCQNCNALLGHAFDSIPILRQAIIYLERQ
jgi:hypothetical protein